MKKQVFLLMFIASGLLITSCADEQTFETENSKIEQRALGDNKYDVLGHGCDVTSTYLEWNCARSSVLDLKKLEAQKRIDTITPIDTKYKLISGLDAVEYSRNISASAKLKVPALLFSGSLNAKFDASYKFDSSESFATYYVEVVKKGYNINATNAILKKCLNDRFIQDLKNNTPAEIVKAYGTHVFTDVVLGGRAELSVKATSTSSLKKQAVEAKMAASFAKIFNAKASISYDESLAKTVKTSSVYIHTIGGVSSFSSGFKEVLAGVALPSASLDLGSWINSVNKTVPQLIKVRDQSLIPIYELIEDPIKSAEIERYINQYIDGRQIETIAGYGPVGGVRSIPLHTWNNQGAGVAIGDFNGNGRPDLVLMAIDDCNGATNFNEYFYKILYDIDEYGNSYNHSPLIKLGKRPWGELNEDGSISITDLNKNGIPDIIFLCADRASGANPFFYVVAFDVDKNGKPAKISDHVRLDPMGDSYQGVGIDLYDFNSNGKLDMILSVYDNPSGANSFAYKILYDIDEGGIFRGGSTQRYTVDGVGDNGQGSGVAVADIDKNGQPDILFGAIDDPDGENKFAFNIIWDVDRTGKTYKPMTRLRPQFINLNIGTDHRGGDFVLYDIDNNGVLDILTVALDNNPKGPNSWKYLTGFDLDRNANPKYWR